MTPSSKASIQLCCSRLAVYGSGLPVILSPLLLAVFVAGCFILTREEWKRLRIPIFAALCGVFLISAVSSISLLELRYAIPITLSVAMISAHFLTKLLTGSKWSYRAAGMIVMIIDGLQFMVINVAPYPTPRLCPTPPGDVWGQQWILDTIAAAQKNHACYINVIPNTRELNGSTLQLIAFYHAQQIYATNPRMCDS